MPNRVWQRCPSNVNPRSSTNGFLFVSKDQKNPKKNSTWYARRGIGNPLLDRRVCNRCPHVERELASIISGMRLTSVWF
ncbi:hypothetical protein TNCV_4650121 [Trichonephila clavipes]|nr:hypothetical protein TNCV_4650121 [Trichonephila clavipes]